MARSCATTHTVADRIPDDDALWRLLHHEGLSVAVLAARLGLSRNTAAHALRLRGWRSRPEPTAPCHGCGEVRGFDDLDAERVCCECRGVGKATDPVGRIAAAKQHGRRPRSGRRPVAPLHDLVVREREASLARQAARLKRGEVEHTGCRHWPGVRYVRPAA